MKAEIIRIGNSQGIRLPKAVLEQCGLQGTVEMEVHDGRLIIQPAAIPRAGWDKAFSQASKVEEEKLIDEFEPIVNEWDETEWEW